MSNITTPNLVLLARDPQRYEDAQRRISRRLEDLGYAAPSRPQPDDIGYGYAKPVTQAA